MSDAITAFRGAHRWMSNFWPVDVVFEGVSYPSVEHAYQAAKTLDPAIRAAVRECATASAAKKAGRTFTIRADWDAVRLEIMRGLLVQKFQRPDLAELLRATGTAHIEEGNTWNDRFFGVVRVGDTWEGLNHMGRLLMEIRASLPPASRSADSG